MPFADKAATIYILDTNIVIHGVRGSLLWQRIKEMCDPLMAVPRPAIRIVSEGEVRSFAEQQQWSDVKQNQMDFLLNYFTRAAIDSPQVLQAYAKIDAFSRAKGFRMGKNDLWIAAVAQVTGAVLVTTDKDFEHLYPTIIQRVLIS